MFRGHLCLQLSVDLALSILVDGWGGFLTRLGMRESFWWITLEILVEEKRAEPMIQGGSWSIGYFLCIGSLMVYCVYPLLLSLCCLLSSPLLGPSRFNEVRL